MKPNTLPRCCIIGAGCQWHRHRQGASDRGIPFDWFEMSDRVGGQWAFDNPNGRSAAYRSLHIDTSKGPLQLADFPVPADTPHLSAPYAGARVSAGLFRSFQAVG